MGQRIVFIIPLLISLSLIIETVDADITGTVKNSAGKGISGASVTLAGKKLNATADSSGSFALKIPTSVMKPLLQPQSTTITLKKGFIDFSLTDASPVKVEIFDLRGNLLKKEVMEHAHTGVYRYSLAETFQVPTLLVIRAAIGQEVMMFRYLPQKSNKKAVNSSVANSASMGGGLSKIAAAIDTLKTAANGFKTNILPISSFDTTVNIILESAGVTVQLDQPRQQIVGFGINATIVKSGASMPWDQLFKLEGTDALGFTILRIGMNTDGGLRDVPSDFEKARTNGAKIIGSCWSAPGSWKDNGKEDQGGHLLASHYADWAGRIATFAKQYNLYAMAVANECDFASCKSKGPPCTDDYASMVYTGKEMAAFVKEARKVFKDKAPNVKVIAPEASEWEHVWSTLSSTQKAAGLYNNADPLGCGCFSNDINDTAERAKCKQSCLNGDGYDYGHWLAKDTASWNAFDILGVHEYEAQIAYQWPTDVTGGKRTKEIWQTEMSGVMYWPEQGPSLTIENGVAVARWIQSALVVGEASAWCYWWYEAYYQNDNEGLALIQGNSNKAKRYYTMGNYSRYIRPGQTVVNITGTDKLPAKVLLTASKDDAGKVVIVAVNETTTDQSVDITISGGTAPSSFTPIVTDKDNNWKEMSAISVSGGVLKAALVKMSVTTFVSK